MQKVKTQIKLTVTGNTTCHYSVPPRFSSELLIVAKLLFTNTLKVVC